MLYFIKQYLDDISESGDVYVDRFSIIDNDSGIEVGGAEYIMTGSGLISIIRTALSRTMNIKDKYTVRFIYRGKNTDFHFSPEACRFVPITFKYGLYPDPALVIITMEDQLKERYGSLSEVDKLKQKWPVTVKVGDTKQTLPEMEDLMHWRSSLHTVLKHCLDKVGPITCFHIGFYRYLAQVKLVDYNWQVELLELSHPSMILNTIDDVHISTPVPPEIEVIEDESEYLKYLFNQDITDAFFREMGSVLIPHLPLHVNAAEFLVRSFLSSTVTVSTNHTTDVAIDTDNEDIDTFARDVSNGISNLAFFIAANYSKNFSIVVNVKIVDYQLYVPCAFEDNEWKIGHCEIKTPEPVKQPAATKPKETPKEKDIFIDPLPPMKKNRSALQDDNSTTYHVIGLSRNAVKSAVIDSVIKREHASPKLRFLAIAEELSKRYREDTGFNLITRIGGRYIFLLFEEKEIAYVDVDSDGLVVFYQYENAKQLAKINVSDSKAIAHVIIRCVKNAQ